MDPYECLYREADLPDGACASFLADPFVDRVVRSLRANVVPSTPRRVTSLVVRNEAIFAEGLESRAWAWRTLLWDGDSPRRFLGFIDRRHEDLVTSLKRAYGDQVPTVCECCTMLPQQLRMAGYRTIEGPYSAYYGMSPVNVTPLVFPHELVGGACAHSALHTALLLMSPHGARPLGPLEIGLIACGAATEDEASLQTGGLRPAEIEAVLNHPDTGVAALLEFVPGHWSGRALGHLLCECVRNELPVIVGVDYNEWIRQARALQEVDAERDPYDREGDGGHASIIVGYRGASGADEMRLLFMDTVLGPWVTMSVDGLSSAASQYAGPGEGAASAVVIVPVPYGVRALPSLIMAAAASHIRRFAGAECAPEDLRLTLFGRDEFAHLCERRLVSCTGFAKEWAALYGRPMPEYLWHVRRTDEVGPELVYDATEGAAQDPLVTACPTAFVLFRRHNGKEHIRTWMPQRNRVA